MEKAQRVTISVPGFLRRRMKEHPNIIWSRVATKAFIEVIRDEERKRKADEMQDVIERMRSIGNKTVEQEGFDQGREWAMETATPKQLRLVERIDPDTWLSDSPPEDYTDWFAFTALQLSPDGADLDEARRAMFGDDWRLVHLEDQGDYLRMFCKGALEVWDVVKNEL